MLENNEENAEKAMPKSEVVNNETPKIEEVQITESQEKTTEEIVDDTANAVEEIEKSVAEDAEEIVPKEEEVLAVDYSKLSLEELVSELENTLSNNPVQKIKSKVDVEYRIQVVCTSRLSSGIITTII